MRDSLFETKMEQYAELLIKVGLHIRGGEKLMIEAPIECAPIVRKCAAKAYQAGCRDVAVLWSDDEIKRQQFLYADSEVLDEYPAWERVFKNASVEEGVAQLYFYIGDPNALDGVDPSRIVRRRKAYVAAVPEYFRRIESMETKQCTASPPIIACAKLTYPDLAPEEALKKQWDAVFRAMRIDGVSDPVAKWRVRAEEMWKQRQLLNQYRFRSLHYKNALGTDFTVRLHEKHIWDCVFNGADGYAINFPSEEIYTVPLRDSANGTVCNSLPLQYQGSTIDRFCLTFKDGAVTQVHAGTGEEVLRQLIAADDGACRLGEIALVPKSTEISKMKMLFNMGLYDENASCHIALGLGLPFCIEGGTGMSPEEKAAHGINDSIVHIDFMIGTEDLSIIGTTPEGKEIPIFVDGDFADAFKL